MTPNSRPTDGTPPGAARTPRPEPPAGVRVDRQLGRGIVWSDLLAEMEQEWADKQRAPVVPLPRAADPGDAQAGEAA